MFELVIIKKCKYRNESFTYEYSCFKNMINAINYWLDNNIIKESDIYNIRYVKVV